MGFGWIRLDAVGCGGMIGGMRWDVVVSNGIESASGVVERSRRVQVRVQHYGQRSDYNTMGPILWVQHS
jgi:hypothetical protein